MTNNDIIRQLRYIFDFSDQQMQQVFAAANYDTDIQSIKSWLTNNESQQTELTNAQLNVFLDGLINEKRGKRDDYKLHLDDELSNNLVLRKLKIALHLKSHDILSMMNDVDANISKHELSAFFRHPDQSQYRDMGNQYLRNFLHGLKKQLRS